MSSILNIAVSGLNDAVARSANAASNIVNAQSTNFSPQEVVSVPNAAAGNDLGVITTVQPSADATTDIASNLIALNTAQSNYGADAAVVKIAQKMENALVDIKT